MAGTRRHLTETAQALGKGSLPGGEARTGYHHGHHPLPITTATGSHSWTPAHIETGIGHHGTEAPAAEEAPAVVVVAPVGGVISTLTYRVTSESAWIGTAAATTLNGPRGHGVDRQSPEDGCNEALRTGAHGLIAWLYTTQRIGKGVFLFAVFLIPHLSV